MYEVLRCGARQQVHITCQLPNDTDNGRIEIYTRRSTDRHFLKLGFDNLCKQTTRTIKRAGTVLNACKTTKIIKKQINEDIICNACLKIHMLCKYVFSNCLSWYLCEFCNNFFLYLILNCLYISNSISNYWYFSLTNWIKNRI